MKPRLCRLCRKPLPPHALRTTKYHHKCSHRLQNEAARRTREKKRLSEDGAVKRPARKAVEPRAAVRLCSWCGFPLPGRSRDTLHKECREECVAQKKFELNHLRLQEEPLCPPQGGLVVCLGPGEPEHYFMSPDRRRVRICERCKALQDNFVAADKVYGVVVRATHANAPR